MSPLTNLKKFFQSGEKPIEELEVDDGKTSRIFGKITKVDKREDGGGYGFISSREIPYQRIFFHWTSLLSYNFLELERGMEVSFIPIETKEYVNKEGEVIPSKGWRAIKVKVENEN